MTKPNSCPSLECHINLHTKLTQVGDLISSQSFSIDEIKIDVKSLLAFKWRVTGIVLGAVGLIGALSLLIQLEVIH